MESGQRSPAPAEQAAELGNRFVSVTVMRCPAQPAPAVLVQPPPDLPFLLDGRLLLQLNSRPCMPGNGGSAAQFCDRGRLESRY